MKGEGRERGREKRGRVGEGGGKREEEGRRRRREEGSIERRDRVKRGGMEGEKEGQGLLRSQAEELHCPYLYIKKNTFFFFFIHMTETQYTLVQIKIEYIF